MKPEFKKDADEIYQGLAKAERAKTKADKVEEQITNPANGKKIDIKVNITTKRSDEDKAFDHVQELTEQLDKFQKFEELKQFIDTLQENNMGLFSKAYNCPAQLDSEFEKSGKNVILLVFKLKDDKTGKCRYYNISRYYEIRKTA